MTASFEKIGGEKEKRDFNESIRSPKPPDKMLEEYLDYSKDEKIVKDLPEIIASHLKELSLSAMESEGFLYFPKGSIKVIPDKVAGAGGIIEIREPEKKIGTEDFAKGRDPFEKKYFQEMEKSIRPLADFENKVFSGEIAPAEFYPEGGRLCLTVVKIYETKEGRFVLMPILPDSGQRYGTHAKISGSNMMRGTRFPRADEIKNFASKKEKNIFEKLQKENPGEKIISQTEFLKTGLWTIRLIDKKGRFSDIHNGHIQRDSETGTLDVFLAQKQFIFEDLENFQAGEKIPPGLERAEALVSFEKIKKAKKGEPLELKKVFFAGEEVNDLENLPPDEYRHLFEFSEGLFCLKEFKPVPPLEAFLKYEEKVVEQTPGNLENEIRQKIGELFENLFERISGIRKNIKSFSIKLPPANELEKILENQPEKFKRWALAQGGEIVVVPDFVLDDGTFLEVKSGGKMALKPEKRDQLFRMVLYKLLKGEEIEKIKFLTLQEKSENDPVFSEIKYESIFESAWKDKITERDLRPIGVWQNSLPK